MTTPTTEVDRSIRVAGWKPFAEAQWREAILFYLNGIWGDKQNVVGNPTIQLGDVTLRLVKKIRYYAYTSKVREKKEQELLDRFSQLERSERRREWEQTIPQHFTIPECLEVNDQPIIVHEALMRFVRSPKIRMLTISLYGAETFTMWKTENRGELRMTSFGLKHESEFILEQAETVACWR